MHYPPQGYPSAEGAKLLLCLSTCFSLQGYLERLVEEGRWQEELTSRDLNFISDFLRYSTKCMDYRLSGRPASLSTFLLTHYVGYGSNKRSRSGYKGTRKPRESAAVLVIGRSGNRKRARAKRRCLIFLILRYYISTNGCFYHYPPFLRPTTRPPWILMPNCRHISSKALQQLKTSRSDALNQRPLSLSCTPISLRA